LAAGSALRKATCGISGSKGRLASRGALVVLWKWAAAFQTQG
jgi:hypothetical protein